MSRVLSLAVIAILIAGCSHPAPVTYTFPNLPISLQKNTCGDLTLINKPTIELSELLETVTENYARYHNCRALVDAWNLWYAEQKNISRELK